MPPDPTIVGVRAAGAGAGAGVGAAARICWGAGAGMGTATGWRMMADKAWYGSTAVTGCAVSKSTD